MEMNLFLILGLIFLGEDIEMHNCGEFSLASLDVNYKENVTNCTPSTIELSDKGSISSTVKDSLPQFLQDLEEVKGQGFRPKLLDKIMTSLLKAFSLLSPNGTTKYFSFVSKLKKYTGAFHFVPGFSRIHQILRNNLA